MEYCKRLPMITPGTMIATSEGVAEFVSHASMQGISRPLVEIKRKGVVFVELGDECS